MSLSKRTCWQRDLFQPDRGFSKQCDHRAPLQFDRLGKIRLLFPSRRRKFGSSALNNPPEPIFAARISSTRQASVLCNGSTPETPKNFGLANLPPNAEAKLKLKPTSTPLPSPPPTHNYFLNFDSQQDSFPTAPIELYTSHAFPVAACNRGDDPSHVRCPSGGDRRLVTRAK